MKPIKKSTPSTVNAKANTMKKKSNPAPVIIDDTPKWFVGRIRKMSIPLEKEADEAEAKYKARHDKAQEEYEILCREYAGLPPTPFVFAMAADWRFHFFEQGTIHSGITLADLNYPGIHRTVCADELPQASAPWQFLKKLRDARLALNVKLANRDRFSRILDVCFSHAARFKDTVRKLYGSQPTEAQCELVLNHLLSAVNAAGHPNPN